MGTNYYLVRGVCEHCGRGEEKQHIGKNSGGWCFLLHVCPEEGINGLEDWKNLWNASSGGLTRIEDEYGDQVSVEEMERIIVGKDKQVIRKKNWWKPYYTSEADFYAQNHAMRGPNGLARSKIDGRHCVGHEETWDLIVGEFC